MVEDGRFECPLGAALVLRVIEAVMREGRFLQLVRHVREVVMLVECSW